MRIRTLAVAALLVAPSVAVAQRPRVPTRGTVPEPAPLPPTIPVVSQAIQVKQSRWAVEAYSLMSVVQVAKSNGSLVNFTTIGSGLRGDYRLNDRWSTTFDLTSSPFGGSATSQTVELGTRYMGSPWDRGVRPFVDARADYMGFHDMWEVDGFGQTAGQYARSSRGFGLVAGAGLEVPLTSSFAISSGLSAVRNRMTAFAISGPGAVPTGQGYWMTSVRWAVAIRWNPATTMR